MIPQLTACFVVYCYCRAMRALDTCGLQLALADDENCAYGLTRTDPHSDDKREIDVRRHSLDRHEDSQLKRQRVETDRSTQTTAQFPTVESSIRAKYIYLYRNGQKAILEEALRDLEGLLEDFADEEADNEDGVA